MNRFLLCAALLLTALPGFAQGVKIQWATTNTGPVVTNIVRILSSNLLPNRLSATNTIPSQVRVYAATNINSSGFWLDPSTLTPGAATNVIDVAAGTGITVATNSLLRTISTAAVTNQDTRALTFPNVIITNFPVPTMPQVLLNPPHVGVSYTVGDFDTVGFNSASVMLPGCGILREIWVQCDIGYNGGLNTNTPNLWLEVFVDGGDTTNLAFRTINANIADLFSNRYRFTTNGEWSVLRDSFGINSEDVSTNLLGGGYIKTFQLRLPVYYTNYCLIRMTNSGIFVNANTNNYGPNGYVTFSTDTGKQYFFTPAADEIRLTNGTSTYTSSTEFIASNSVTYLTGTTGTPVGSGVIKRIGLWDEGYINAAIENASDLSALGAFKNWRLRTVRTNGVFGTGSNFMFSATGPGICVGFLQSLLGTNVSDRSFLDSVGPSFITSPSSQWKPSGGDDMSLSTYAMFSGQRIGYNVGVLNRWAGSNNQDIQFAIEWYRWFTSDAIYWTNGVTVYIPSYVFHTIPQMHATMFYYGP